MRVVFLGTPEFAIPALRRLIEEVEVVAVITQPDRKAGRGQKITPPPVKVVAQQAGIPVHQPERIRHNAKIQQTVTETAAEVMIVVAFGQILPADFFNIPPLGTLNIHASLLPKYRGAAPVVHALLNGDRATGVTIMKIDEGMDTGDILSQAEIPIEDDTTAGELEVRLAGLGADLLLETLPRYRAGEVQPRPQNHRRATYAPRIRKEDARIDWHLSATRIRNQIRAFNPWPGGFAQLGSEPVRFWKAEVTSSVPGGFEPGQVMLVDGRGFVVRCGGEGEGLRILELQRPDRGRISGGDFVRGYRLCQGDRFS